MMKMIVALTIAYSLICSVSSKRLRGAQTFIPRSRPQKHVDKRQLLENIDSYTFNPDQYKPQYDKQDIGILDVVNMIQTPTNKVEMDVYDLPKDFTTNDYVGQIHGLLPTLSKYHNDHFFLSMDIREHQYEEVTLDVFGYIHDVNLQSNRSTGTKPEIDNNDLFYRQDTRSVVGLMGLLPGYNPLSSMDNELIESRAPYDSNSMLDILGKSASVTNNIDSDAYESISSRKYHWVGMLHGLLPGGSVYHNDDFFLSFATLEHKYDSVAHNFLDIIDTVTAGDKIDGEVYQPLMVGGADGKVVLGLIGLLPGEPKPTDHFILGDIIDESINLQQKTVSSTILDVLGMVSADELVNPEAYKSTNTVLHNGHYVGLQGLLPDQDQKMKYLRYGWDDLIGLETDGSSSPVLDMFNLIQVSKTTGTSMNAPKSGHDITAMILTHAPVVCGSSYGDCGGISTLSDINTSVHAVRCCSDFERPGWEQNSGCNVWAESEINGTCYETASYASAHDICSSQGARLCTQSELESDCAAGSGCELDHHMAWATPFGIESIS